MRTLVSVGLLDKNSQWHIKIVKIIKDKNGLLWPKKIIWPNGVHGEFHKFSKNGKVLYHEM